VTVMVWLRIATAAAAPLAEGGFTVERGSDGLPAAFTATVGSGDLKGPSDGQVQDDFHWKGRPCGSSAESSRERGRCSYVEPSCRRATMSANNRGPPNCSVHS
jgi:hypothetical protein